MKFESLVARSPNYRADIDGLRALAILPVLFYHAGIGIFSGGFVGVDVFFVISGFLISSIVIHDIDKGAFSFAIFYERRVRRIFPALFSVTLFCVIASLILLAPKDLADLGKSMLAMTVFSSNIYFRRNFGGDGYFGDGSDTQALLHTWSLSVEEQFYIFFPALLIGIRRWFPRYQASLLWLCAVISFGVSLWAVSTKPVAAFYLLIPRAWELMCGAILALTTIPSVSKRWLRELLGGLGIMLIVWAVFNLNKQTPFPGAAALFPCAGACLVIYAGSQGATFAGKILCARPLVLIGLISYSLYLWHWPIIVFCKYFLVGDLGTTGTAICIATSLLMAYLSFVLIERPFRDGRSLLTRQKIFLFGGVASTATLILGMVFACLHGLPQRYSPEIRMKIARNAAAKEDYKEKCSNFRKEVRGPSDIEYCTIGYDQPHTILFVGDSHVQQLIPLLETMHADGALGNHNALFAVSTGCPPAPHLNVTDRRFYCDAFARAAFERALSPDVDAVFIGFASWLALEDNKLCSTEEGISCQKPLRHAEASKQFLRELAQQIRLLQTYGKNVIISLPFPMYDRPIPEVQIHNLVWGGSGGISVEDTADPAFHDHIRTLAQREGVLIFDPRASLCSSAGCIREIDGISLYRDANHIVASHIGIFKKDMAAVLDKLSNKPKM